MSSFSSGCIFQFHNFQLVLLYNFYFFAETLFFYFKITYNCFLKDFYEGCIKVRFRSSQQLIHFSFGIYHFFPIQVVIFYFSFEYYIMRLQILFNLLKYSARVEWVSMFCFILIPTGTTQAKADSWLTLLHWRQVQYKLSSFLSPTDMRKWRSRGLNNTALCFWVGVEGQLLSRPHWHQGRRRKEVEYKLALPVSALFCLIDIG